MNDTLQCECKAKGHCTRRNAHVGKHQFEQCQAGRVEHVDRVIEALAKQRKPKKQQSPSPKPKPIPRDQWPRWAKLIARFSKPRDIGVGDTVQRIAEKFGGELFKKWSKSLGVPCGCTERRNTFNTKYPYKPEKERPPLDGRMITIDPVPRVKFLKPTKRRALVVVAPDAKPQAELKISGPLLRKYAEECEADYIELTDFPPLNHPCANKYVVSQIAREYEQTMLADTDIIPLPGAACMFDAVPVGMWGLVDDLVNLEALDLGVFLRHEWGNFLEKSGKPLIPLEKAWNSGLFIAPTDAEREYHVPPMPVPNYWCTEQHYHTWCLMHSGRIVDLPQIWQAGFLWKNFPEVLKTAHFAHICGCQGPHRFRLAFMEHFARGTRTISRDLIKMYEAEDAPTQWRPFWLAKHRKTDYSTRKAMVGDVLPKQVVGCEIGVLRGQFARVLSRQTQPRRLHLVDRWRLNTEHDWRPRQNESWEQIHSLAVRLGLRMPHRVDMYEASSLDWLRSQPADSLDWVYIDAAHDYESVKAELIEARRVVKGGGLILGHDYAIDPVDAHGNRFPCGVVQAVEFAVQSGYGEVVAVSHDRLPSFAMRTNPKPQARSES